VTLDALPADVVKHPRNAERDTLCRVGVLGEVRLLLS